MTITSTTVESNVALNRLSGSFLDTGTPDAVVIDVGFLPRYVKWVNTTTAVMWEWFTGMANGTTLKTSSAGAKTLDTADVAISIAQTVAQGALTADAYLPVRVKGSFQVTVAAAIISASDQCYYEIRE